MATSGSFTTGNYNGKAIKFSWERTGTGIENGTPYSIIKWSLKGSGGSGYHITQNGYLNIANGRVWTQSGSVNLYDGTVLASGSNMKIWHNLDGTRTFSADAGAGIFTNAVNCTGSGTWTLDTIPMYPTANQSLNSKTSSSIKMNWSSDSTIDYVWYSKDNGSSWNAVGSVNAKSGSYTISGLSANTNYNIKTRVRRSGTSLTKDSSALSVKTYAKTVPTISLSSKTSSSITVSSGCNVSVSSTQYRIKQGSGNYGNYQNGATFSGLSANTTYTIEVKKVGSDSGESGTATISVTTYNKTIPTISLSSKTVNSITVSSGCNVNVSSTQYRIKQGSGNYGNYQNSATFSGLSPNTNYTIEVKKVATDSKETGTATLSVTTYDIAKLTSAPNINFGDTARLLKTNPSGATNRIRVETLNPTVTIATRDNIGNDYTISFNDSEWDTLYKKLGTNNSITIRYVVDTIVGNNTYFNWIDRILTIKGNQKTGHIKINNSWKRAKMYCKVNGTWKRAVLWVKENNTWKRTI